MKKYSHTAVYIKGLRAAQLHRLDASPPTPRIPGRSLAPAPAAWNPGGRCCRLRPIGMRPNADSLCSGSSRWLHVLDPCFAPGRESPRGPQENPKRTPRRPQEDPKRTPREPQASQTPKAPGFQASKPPSLQAFKAE